MLLRAFLHITLCLPLFVTFASAQTHKSRINGQCGPTNGVATTTTPSSGLCSAGTASTVSGTGPWTWNCIGSRGGSTANCSAPVAMVVNGACGPANGTPTSSAPTSGLCSAGTAGTIMGTGPWNWLCNGVEEYQRELLRVARIVGRSTFATRSGYKVATGLMSQGGVPNRTTICATRSPLGGGRDDTANIQSAIDACPLEQVVQLSAGTFIINSGNVVFINKGVTLRGAVPARLFSQNERRNANSYFPGPNPSPLVIIVLAGGRTGLVIP